MQIPAITLNDAQADALYLALTGSDPTAPLAPARASRETSIIEAHAAMLRGLVHGAHLRMLDAARGQQRTSDEAAARALTASIR